MLVVMKTGAARDDIDRVCRAISDLQLTPHPIPGKLRTAIGITGNVAPVDPTLLSALPGVIDVIRVTKPYKLTGRGDEAGGHRRPGRASQNRRPPVNRNRGAVLGRIAANRCSAGAPRLKELGADIMRGGAL